MVRTAIPIPIDAIAAFCRRHHIRRLGLFGSVLCDDFGPDSDVDVIVEFEPGRTPGLSFFDLPDELAAIIGRPVDVLTRPGVEAMRNPIRRRSILEGYRTIYESDGA